MHNPGKDHQGMCGNSDESVVGVMGIWLGECNRKLFGIMCVGSLQSASLRMLMLLVETYEAQEEIPKKRYAQD